MVSITAAYPSPQRPFPHFLARAHAWFIRGDRNMTADSKYRSGWSTFCANACFVRNLWTFPFSLRALSITICTYPFSSDRWARTFRAWFSVPQQRFHQAAVRCFACRGLCSSALFISRLPMRILKDETFSWILPGSFVSARLERNPPTTQTLRHVSGKWRKKTEEGRAEKSRGRANARTHALTQHTRQSCNVHESACESEDY